MSLPRIGSEIHFVSREVGRFGGQVAIAKRSFRSSPSSLLLLPEPRFQVSPDCRVVSDREISKFVSRSSHLLALVEHSMYVHKPAAEIRGLFIYKMFRLLLLGV